MRSAVKALAGTADDQYTTVLLTALCAFVAVLGSKLIERAIVGRCP